MSRDTTTLSMVMEAKRKGRTLTELQLQLVNRYAHLFKAV